MDSGALCRQCRDVVQHLVITLTWTCWINKVMMQILSARASEHMSSEEWGRQCLHTLHI